MDNAEDIAGRDAAVRAWLKTNAALLILALIVMRETFGTAWFWASAVLVVVFPVATAWVFCLTWPDIKAYRAATRRE